MKRLLSMAMLVLLLGSCIDDQYDILFRGQMFGYMSGNAVFKGDDGGIYRFRSIPTAGGLPSQGRIVAQFDVYSKVEGTDNEFIAELNDFAVPVYKAPVVNPSESEAEALGKAPIKVENCGVSGGCLNMICSISTDIFEHASYIVNLQADTPASPGEPLRLRMRHKVEGVAEVFGVSSQNTSFYASFPLEGIVTKGVKTPAILEWTWNEETEKAEFYITMN